MTGYMGLNSRKMSRHKKHTRKNEEDRETNKNREIYGTN
jgi:hypothetical protein